MSKRQEKVSHLVVDSVAFLKNAPIFEYGAQVYTVQSVVDEIKDQATRERLQVLPDELTIREPGTDSLKFVSEFSKKTGDYPRLSATDIRILALTYELHKDHVGTENLRTEPLSKVSVKPYSPAPNEKNNLPGFYRPKDKESENEEVSEGEEEEDEGWVAPENLEEAMKSMGLVQVENENEPVVVSCITADFAMQNTLIQMGIHVISVDGMLIKYAKTFILRCYGCFKTTSTMTAQFCPHCGNKTLKRVAVSINADGTKVLHLNFRRPINARGSRYSLPMPKGGKHAQNPILVADQPTPQNRPSKMGSLKTDALNEDYNAGFSPFALNDVYSRAANLGIHGRRSAAKNPNPNIRRRK